jgi:hypothetical protein
MLVNGGLDSMACAMGGDTAGYTGTATASSATSLTATGTPWVASAYVGHIVVTSSAAMAYGVVTANTTSVLTVDQWYAPGSPGGAATTTPTSTTTFTIVPGNAPNWYMALTTNATAPSATDTVLTSEITTAGGGLIRKLATYAHTTGATTYSLAATFTVNGSDTGLPVTIPKIGIFNTLVGATGRMQFETLLGTTAVLSAVGDSVTCTDTVTI